MKMRKNYIYVYWTRKNINSNEVNLLKKCNDDNIEFLGW
jgi:hypothetical protein